MLSVSESSLGKVSVFISVLTFAVVPLGCASKDRGPARQADARQQVDGARHLLDPLTQEELETAATVIKSDSRWNPNMGFSLVTLNEPPKSFVLGSDGAPVRREALAIVIDKAANLTSEVVVDVLTRAILRWQAKPGVQANYLLEDYTVAEELVKADPRWRALAAQRGIRDLDNAHIDVWGYGGTTPNGARLIRGLTFARDGVRNAYSRPVEGLVAIVNLNTRQVVSVENTGNALIPPGAEYSKDLLPSFREPPKPLDISQPEGPSFIVDGHLVKWQKWQFRWGFLPREGLVLYQVGYEDAGRVRPILYKATVAEAAAMYADPDPNWSWRNALDVGEYNMGVLSTSLVPGKDVPRHSTFFDAVLAGDDGQPYTLPQAVALYEMDDGLLWKHVSEDAPAEIRRARSLVILYSAVVGNYDYVFQWIFRQDGTLEARVFLSGILLAKGSEPTRYGTTVAPGTVAIHHEHMLSYRLDLDVDGPSNSIFETHVRALPTGPDNPRGNAFVAERTLMAVEEGRDRSHGRQWRVVNPNETNSLGEHPGFVLLPGMSDDLIAQPDSSVRSRTGFAHKAVWLTRQRDEELYASGTYTVQSSESTGLPSYVNGEPLENSDVVLWYTLNHVHIPRPEEWPVMPRASLGFTLAPFGFFTQNPALDVPDTEPQ
ncbi:primary-amine oxidase [Archangium minus]|uniref:Amine oxidase n=1 Tax=Archangium minus TaxID=83450 RepID=A0ABY9WTV3_9BACT|nr:primary-amine oxidase [Archangium minus]